MPRLLPGSFRRFVRNADGSVAIQFALAVVPLAGLVGVIVDYGRASNFRADMQAAIDTAVLVGARLGEGDEWSDAAADYFEENVARNGAAPVTPTFAMDDDGNVTGSAAMAMPTSVLAILGVESVDIGVGAVALVEKRYDNSCLLALGTGAPMSEDSIAFNGAPNVAFDQCSIRSNTSISCNGHSGGAIASIAAGSAGNCANPQSDATVVPDIYASLASNITHSCGAGAAVTWTPGQVPAGVTSVNRGTHIEYRVCGDLTLSGNGFLTGASPAQDSVIIVENGDLTIASDATVSTKRVAIVLTGNNTAASSISFPNGKGKLATLSLSPPTSAGNPWRGISLYQDPILTQNVDHDWGPGAALVADGVVYLPNSDVTMRGNGSSNVSNCTKFVSNSFRTNGAVDINFRQSESACDALGVDQWYEAEPYLGH